MSHTTSLLKVAALGDRMSARATITMVEYDEPGGEVITAAELGLRYIEDVVVLSAPDAVGISLRSTLNAGTAVISIYDEDNTTGVEAELADGAYTGVFRILALGY